MKDTKAEYLGETSEPVATVLSRLKGVKRLCPGYYEAICPLEDCQRKQLLVIEGEDERAMIECDDGCWLSEIVPALGLTVEDLFRSIDDIYIGTTAPKYEPPREVAEEARNRQKKSGSIPCPEGTPVPEWPNFRVIN